MIAELPGNFLKLSGKASFSMTNQSKSSVCHTVHRTDDQYAGDQNYYMNKRASSVAILMYIRLPGAEHIHCPSKNQDQYRACLQNMKYENSSLISPIFRNTTAFVFEI